MLRIKDQPEMSDTDEYLYWDCKTPINEFLEGKEQPFHIMVHGDECVRALFGRPLSECIGNAIRVGNMMFRAQYKFSEQTARPGRAKAYHKIENSIPNTFGFTYKSIKEMDFIPDIPTSFDVETGGKSGIRCICFYNPNGWFKVDCRDVKSSKEKRDFLKKLFTSDVKWIAHNAVHDVEQVSRMLKIPVFPIHIDTIAHTDGYEFKSLRYLSGVIIGCEPYKHELERANETQDFERLVEYCAKDAMYTYMLANRLKVRDSKFVNQFIYTMINKPNLVFKEDLFQKYPQLKGKTKAELRKSLGLVNPRDAQLLIKTVNPPKVLISYHTAEGFKVVIPDELTYNGDLYFKSSTNMTNVVDIMASDLRYDSAELSVYRYKNNIEPTLHFADFDISPSDVFLVNDVICLTTKPKEGWTKCTLDEVRVLFNGKRT